MGVAGVDPGSRGRYRRAIVTDMMAFRTTAMRCLRTIALALTCLAAFGGGAVMAAQDSASNQFSVPNRVYDDARLDRIADVLVGGALASGLRLWRTPIPTGIIDQASDQDFLGKAEQFLAVLNGITDRPIFAGPESGIAFFVIHSDEAVGDRRRLVDGFNADEQTKREILAQLDQPTGCGSKTFNTGSTIHGAIFVSNAAVDPNAAFACFVNEVPGLLGLSPGRDAERFATAEAGGEFRLSGIVVDAIRFAYSGAARPGMGRRELIEAMRAFPW